MKKKVWNNDLWKEHVMQKDMEEGEILEVGM
jgi:hypothetical protein